LSGTTADVYKGGKLAARLTHDLGGTTFAYLPEYLAAGGPPVATTLPLGTEPVLLRGGAVPPFFAGLLPEGRRLAALRRHVKASADDELTLLLAVGSDTVGDVQVVPSGSPPTAAQPLLTIPADLSTYSFEAALKEAAGVDRRSLPGVQEKASGRVINVPAHAGDADVILKLSPPEYPGLVENEAFFLGAARAARLPTVEWRVLEDGTGEKALLVRRFDRVATAVGVRRLAVEDASQVLGIWPADKYNVSMEEAARALIALTAARPVAARSLFQQVAFAVLTGNGDQHAKNLAVVEATDGEWRVSPAYDLPSTLPYGDETLALTIGGSDRPFSRRKLLAFADDLGLPRASATSTLDQLLARTEAPLAAERLATLPFGVSTIRKLAKSLAYRRQQLTATT